MFAEQLAPNPSPPTEAPLALVCDDRPRGARLLEAVDLPDGPIFDARARLGGWEIVQARVVVFWQLAPDLARLRRQLRLSRVRAHAIVIVDPSESEAVALALREGATVIAREAADERLAGELATCLRDVGEHPAPVPLDGLCEALQRTLERRLQRSSPRLRLVASQPIEELVERLADDVLRGARELAVTEEPAGPLDWEGEHTPVQTHEEAGLYRRRSARGAPSREPEEVLIEVEARDVVVLDDPSDLAETRPYASADEGRVEAALRGPASVPPPLPIRAAAPPAPPARVPGWAAALVVFGVAVAGAAAAIALFVPAAPRRPARAVATLRLGRPSVIPVVEPSPGDLGSVRDRGLAEGVTVSGMDLAPARLASADGIGPSVGARATSPEPGAAASAAEDRRAARVSLPGRVERARRAALRARAHRHFGRPARALRSARLAVRLAPHDERYRALLAELEDMAPPPADATPAVPQPQ